MCGVGEDLLFRSDFSIRLLTVDDRLKLMRQNDKYQSGNEIDGGWSLGWILIKKGPKMVK